MVRISIFCIALAIAVMPVAGYELDGNYQKASGITWTGSSNDLAFVQGTFSRPTQGSEVSLINATFGPNQLSLVAVNDSGYPTIEVRWGNPKIITYGILDKIVPDLTFPNAVVHFGIYIGASFIWIETRQEHIAIGQSFVTPLFFGVTDSGLNDVVSKVSTVYIYSPANPDVAPWSVIDQEYSSQEPSPVQNQPRNAAAALVLSGSTYGDSATNP